MKNNKLDVETTIEMTKIDFSNDPETIRIVTEISKECADVTGKLRIFLGGILTTRDI